MTSAKLVQKGLHHGALIDLLQGDGTAAMGAIACVDLPQNLHLQCGITRYFVEGPREHIARRLVPADENRKNEWKQAFRIARSVLIAVHDEGNEGIRKVCSIEVSEAEVGPDEVYHLCDDPFALPHNLLKH